MVVRSTARHQDIGLAWSVMIGYLRTTTHPRIMPVPQTFDVAINDVRSWVGAPISVVLTSRRILILPRSLWSTAGPSIRTMLTLPVFTACAGSIPAHSQLAHGRRAVSYRA